MKNNQLIVKNENTFVNKTRKFFQKVKIKLFGNREENQLKNKSEKINSFVQDEKNEKFLTELKIKYANNVVEKNDFLEEIKENREILEVLSIERLRKLSKYYDEIIEQNNNIIKKLKKST